jgi:hypothetical protein
MDVPLDEYSEHQTSRVTIQCILVRLLLTALIDKMQVESQAIFTFLRDIEKGGRNDIESILSKLSICSNS